MAEKEEEAPDGQLHDLSRLTPEVHAAEAIASAETFDAWAGKYEVNVLAWGYSAHQEIARVALLEAAKMAEEGARLQMLDAGCGTGLVGVALVDQLASGGDGAKAVQARFELHGLDHSSAMLQQAADRNVYATTHCASIGTQPLRVPSSSSTGESPQLREDCSIDLITVAGVFQPGGPAPEAIIELARVTKVGGSLVFSVQLHWFQEAEFEAMARRLPGLTVTTSPVRKYTPGADDSAEYIVCVCNKTAFAVQGGNAGTTEDSRETVTSVSEFRALQERFVERCKVSLLATTAEDAVRELLAQMGRCKYPREVDLAFEESSEATILSAFRWLKENSPRLTLEHLKLGLPATCGSSELQELVAELSDKI